ncbi:S9 family peptidase [Edaphobacter sp. HDX4]|uniref:prolyl oligopeptidase family serine peptidase n=1 Tax=Edaphobacter sp. HDX4 TaxID=2794064 RepID=UPI002FE6B323
MSLTSRARTGVVEVIHGFPVRDPYRWLEDRSLAETEEWLRDQQLRCKQYFAACEGLGAIRAHVRQYLDRETKDQPVRIAERQFYRWRKRSDEQAGIYLHDESEREPRLLVAPSPFNPFEAVGIYRISADASLLAYERRNGGGDQKSIHLVAVEKGELLSDKIETGYSRGFCFASGLQGFYYCHEDSKPRGDHTICFHRLGDRRPDQICFSAERSVGSRLILTGEANHLGVLYLHRAGTGEVVDLWIADQRQPTQWQRVFENCRLPMSVILKNQRLFVLTYDAAPEGELLELDLNGNVVRTIISKREGMICQLVLVHDRVFVTRQHQLQTSLESWSLDGEYLSRLDIPDDSTVQLAPPRSDTADALFYTCESFTQPPSFFQYSPSDGTTRLWHQNRISVSSSRYRIRRTTYAARDGKEIPIELVAAEAFGAPRPVVMTAYGGFGVSMTPQFSVLATIMVELGACFAVCRIRGGGEYGKNWHEAARGRNRQVSFDDFLAAADWLCETGVTKPGRLGIFGGSNAGLLVGAAMTQRPDLFRAVLCIAPLLDMVRYESFDHAAKWREEYGTVESLEDFLALSAYSPYHQVKDDTNYPSVLFVSGDDDDRCNPAHVRKMAARLQDRRVQNSPVIVDYSETRGHSPVLPLSVRIEALSRRIAFLCRELDISVRFGGRDEDLGD